MRRALVGLVALASILCGCSMTADTAIAEQAVPRFHEQLDAARFDAIYNESGDELKKGLSENSSG